jgi:hypothetical protein
MSKRSDITRKRIQDLLHKEDQSQLSLFKVSDMPLKRAIFEYTTDTETNNETNQDKSDPVDGEHET